MRFKYVSVRLLGEAVAIIVFVWVARGTILPAVEPDLGGGVVALHSAILAAVSAMLTLWRVDAAIRRSRIRRARAGCNSAEASSHRAIVASLAVLCAGLACSFFAALRIQLETHASTQAEFGRLVERLRPAIEDRLGVCRSGLYGVRGLFRASKSVERGEFRQYVESLALRVQFHGAYSFGFVRRVARGELDAFLAAERTDEAPSFAVRSTGDLPELYIVSRIEPHAEGGDFVGFDFAADPVLRVALEQAMYTGEPTLSDAVSQAPGEPSRSRYFYLLAVYRNGTNPTTPEERRSALCGWAYTEIVLSEILAKVNDVAGARIRFTLSDRRPDGALFPIYDSEPTSRVQTGGLNVLSRVSGVEPRFQERSAVTLGGREWMLAIGSTPLFEAEHGNQASAPVAVAGTIFSLLLALLIRSVCAGRTRALALVAKLAAANRDTELLLESVDEGILGLDVDGRATFANPAAARMLGGTPDEFVGQRLRDFVRHSNPDHSPGHTAKLGSDAAVSEGPARQLLEGVVSRKDGTSLPIEYAVTRIRAKEGTPNGAVVVLRDITDRRVAEDARRLLSLVTEQSPASIVITDPRGTIEYVNQKFTEVTGYSAQEAVGANPRLLKSGSRREEEYKTLWSTILAGNHWTGEFENRKKNGDVFWEQASISPIRDGEGAIAHFLAVKLDITERKRAEDLLRSTESELRRHRDHLEELVTARTVELAEANQALVHEVEERRAAEKSAAAASAAKGEFLATMSHELRTPLNGVIGMMDLLLRTELDKEQRRFAWLAKSSGDMLLALINDILDFSKIEAGSLELESVEFDLHYSVENVATCLSSRAASKGVGLSCSIHPTVPKFVRGDPGRLQQILTNLVTNAIKFTERGEVMLRVSKDEGSGSDVTVRFTVTDTGIGIPTDRVERLFKSFSQVDASTTRKYGGTGLGLAICKRLVDAMGGEIGVTSAEGQGATFWFVVGLKTSSPSATEDNPFPDDLRQIRVLVVDDNPPNLQAIQAQLTAWKIAHESATGGVEALDALRAAHDAGRPFGMVITEMQLREMDGKQLAREIKNDQSLADTVMVLLTTTADTEDPSELRKLGFAGWASRRAPATYLLERLADAYTCARADSNSPADPPSAIPWPRPPTGTRGTSPHRILVAEDHEISQEVVTAVLRRAGFQCDVVSNGRLAVEAVRTGRYALVLMDCHMPEMDGFQATQAIRDLERQRRLATGAEVQIPIIALTADAIQGDRERCLAAGMDDYATKPLDSERLLSVISARLHSDERVRGAARESAFSEKVDHVDSKSQCACPAFDTGKTLKQWGNDKAFVRRLIAKFASRAPDDLKKLRDAVARRDVAETQRLAHGLKGAAGYVNAEVVRSLAAQLEASAKEGNLDAAAGGLKALDAELQRCAEAVRDCPMPAGDATPETSGVEGPPQ